MSADLSFPLNPALSPRFHELSFENFQRLCRELLAHEPGIQSCEIYGVSGQRQRGVDLIAYPADGHSTVAGECKCYAEFAAAEMVEAVQRFLDNWDHWRERRVGRLILLVACEADRTEVREEEHRQRERLARIGVAFEVWTATAITRRLRGLRALVSAHLGPEWVARICGPEQAQDRPHAVQPMIDLALTEQIAGLSAAISRDIDARVAVLRRSWREGRRREVLEWLDSFVGDRTRQTAAGPAVTAKVLRFHAGLLLEAGRASHQASALAAQARELHPGPDDARILAVIALRERGVEAALEELSASDGTATARLRAGVLLEAGRHEDALEALGSAEPGAESADRAEHARLRSLALFLLGRSEEATLEAQRALDAEPRWVSTRFLAAFLDYQVGLSSAVRPAYVPAWPEPVDWSLVRQDDVGIRSTERALGRFRQLLAEDSDEEECRRLEAWIFACLATLPARHEETTAWSRQVLERAPAHPYAVAWAVARRLPIDLEPSRRALLAKIEASPSPALVVAFCSICLATETPESGLEVLENTAAAFEREHAAWLRRYWHVQLLSAAGRTDEAHCAMDDLGDDGSLVACRVAIARAEFARTNDATAYVRYLEGAFADTGDFRYLIESCLLAADQGDWAYVCRHGATLIETIGTAVTIRLGAIALDAAERYADCLGLLESRAASFALSPLGADIRAIRGFARHARGNIMGAIADLEAVVATRPRTREQFVLAQLYYRKGDFERLASLARELRDREDLSVQQALWLAEALPRENRAIAIALWRSTIQHGLPDEAVGTAVTLGTRLGLDTETRSLFMRMSGLAREGRGGIQVFTVSDVVAMLQERAAGTQELTRQYEQGQLPVHLLGASLRIPLVALYHTWLDEGEAGSDFSSRRILRVRHAGRPHPAEATSELRDRRLTMDITALLLAEHLGLLPLIEEAFAPIRVPQVTVHALRQMSEAVLHHQPSRLAVYHELLQAENRGLLQVRPDPAANLDEAGHVLDFASSESDWQGRRVTPRELVESLRAQGPLNPAEYEAALDALGTEGIAPPSGRIPGQRRNLYCPNNAIETLVDAGLLRAVCERFSVVLATDDQTARRWALEAEARGDRTAVWLRALVGRLNDGLAQGQYELLPLSLQGNEEERVESADPELISLVETLRQEGTERDLLWVDDRAVNRHAFGNGTRIVDVLDILWALRSTGALDDIRLYQILLRLRAANVRYLPMTRDEILYHLRQATVRDGVLIETRGLAVLRRYVAGCLADAGDLQIPPVPMQPGASPGELPLLLGLGREISAAVVELWRDPAIAPQFVRAGSEWIVNSLHVDLALMRASVVDSAPAPSLEVSAVGITGWIVQALGLAPQREAAAGRAREYVAWVESRLIEPRLAAEPELLSTVSAALRHHCFGAAEDQPEELALASRLLVSRRICDLLSDRLGDVVRDDAAFREHIGVEIIATRGDGELEFRSHEFMAAAEAALRGETSSIRTVNGAFEVLFEPAEPPALLRYTHPATGEVRTGNDPLLRLLLADRAVQEAVLREHREWFDVPEERFERMIEEIVAAEDPEARYNLAMRWRAESSSMHYDRLGSQLRGGGPVQEETLRIPSDESLRSHLGIDSEGGAPFKTQWPGAVQRLLDERGLDAALDQCAGVPVACTPEVFVAVDRLTDDESVQLIKRRLRRPSSPVGDLHLLRLMGHLARRAPAFGRLARRAARRLVSPEWQVGMRTFIQILRWVETDLRSRAATPPEAVGTGLALAWYHSHRLFSAFVEANADVERLGELFKQLQHDPPWGVFYRGSAYYNDAAHPLHLSASRFTLAGLGYAVDRAEPTIWPDDARAALLGACFREVNGSLVPDTGLLTDPAQMDDALGSFLHLDQADCAHVLGEEAAELVGSVQLGNLVEEGIRLLESDAATVPAWVALRAILQERPIRSDLAGRLEAILRRVELGPWAEADGDHGAAALQGVAWSGIGVRDPEVRVRIEAQLLDLAGRLPSRAGGATSEEENGLDWSLVEAAAILSLHEGDLESRATAFARVLGQLYAVCPRLLGLTRPAVQRFVDRLPLKAAKPFTNLLFLARRAP